MTLLVESRSVVIAQPPDNRLCREANQRVSGAMDKRLTVSFDLQARVALKALADHLQRSEGWVVRLAVKRLLDEASKDKVQLEFDLKREKQLE